MRSSATVALGTLETWASGSRAGPAGDTEYWLTDSGGMLAAAASPPTELRRSDAGQSARGGAGGSTVWAVSISAAVGARWADTMARCS